jgi:thymidylate kinase
VLEGLDRAGKTTQATQLANFLRNQSKVVLLNVLACPLLFSRLTGLCCSSLQCCALYAMLRFSALARVQNFDIHTGNK